MKIFVSTRGRVALPAALRVQDDIKPGQVFAIDRIERGTYRLIRLESRSKVVDWLLSCPDKGYFVPIESMSTNSCDPVSLHTCAGRDHQGGKLPITSADAAGFSRPTMVAASRKDSRINGMIQPKHKVSLSLPADLVAWIDRQVARKRGGTRSGIVEQAVRGWVKQAAAQDIEDATVAYYQAMTSAEKDEDDEWSRLGGSTWRSRED